MNKQVLDKEKGNALTVEIHFSPKQTGQGPIVSKILTSVASV